MVSGTDMRPTNAIKRGIDNLKYRGSEKCGSIFRGDVVKKIFLNQNFKLRLPCQADKIF